MAGICALSKLRRTNFTHRFFLLYRSRPLSLLDVGKKRSCEPARALHIWLFVKVFSGKREAAVAAVSASVPSIIRLRYAANTRPKLVCTVIEILSQFDLGAFKGV